MSYNCCHKSAGVITDMENCGIKEMSGKFVADGKMYVLMYDLNVKGYILI